jgi:hypothetical protein
MRPIILAVALTFSTCTAFAEDFPQAKTQQPADQQKSNEHVRQCIFKANVFRGAAMYRDAKHSPEDAFENLRGGFPSLDEKFIKTAINDIYFNRDFAYAGGQPLVEQVLDLCMHGPKNWKPLK